MNSSRDVGELGETMFIEGHAHLDIHCLCYPVGDRGGTSRPCLTLAASLM